MKKIKKTAKWKEKAMGLLFLACGLLTILLVILITVFLVISGIPAMRNIGVLDFLSGRVWAPTAASPSYGILPFILASILGTCGAILIGVPVGLFCAVFLAKMSPRKPGAVIRNVVDLLAGIPSVVYGLVGMIILVPWVRELFGLPDGANLFSAILVLAVMILPPVISVSETAIKAVPREYEEASLALGATKTETVFRVVVPAAKSGIATAIVLGIGRAMGEAMAVMMVAGNVANMPRLFGSVRFLTTAVASEMSYSSGLQRQALFSIALILFLFIMAINLALNVLIKRGQKHE